MRARIPEAGRCFAKSLRRNPTDAEQKLWRLLRNRQLSDLKFRRQVPLGNWIVDFVSFEYRLIIEADGSQHVESIRDERRDSDLRERGFRLLRFWNNDVLLKPQSVIEAILVAVADSPLTRRASLATLSHEGRGIERFSSLRAERSNPEII